MTITRHTPPPIYVGGTVAYHSFAQAYSDSTSLGAHYLEWKSPTDTNWQSQRTSSGGSLELGIFPAHYLHTVDGRDRNNLNLALSPNVSGTYWVRFCAVDETTHKGAYSGVSSFVALPASLPPVEAPISVSVAASAANGQASASGGGSMMVYVGESVTINSRATAFGWISEHNFAGYTPGPVPFSIVGGPAKLHASPTSYVSMRYVAWKPTNSGTHTLYTEVFTGVFPGSRQFGISGEPLNGLADKRITVDVRHNPTCELQVLDAAGNPVALDNGAFAIEHGSTFYLKVSGNDADGDAVHYAGRILQSNGLTMHSSNEPRDTGDGYAGSRTFGPYTANVKGNWEVWGHVGDATARAATPPNGNGGGWWASARHTMRVYAPCPDCGGNDCDGTCSPVTSLSLAASVVNGQVSALGGGSMVVYISETVAISSTATATGWLSEHNVGAYTTGTVPLLISATLPATVTATASVLTGTWAPANSGTYTLYAEAFTGTSPGHRRVGISGHEDGPFGGHSDKHITVDVRHNPSGCALQVLNASGNPIAQSNGAFAIQRGDTFFLKISGSDADGDAVRYAARILQPDGVTMHSPDEPHDAGNGYAGSKTFGPYTANAKGDWLVWGHVIDSTARPWGSIMPWDDNAHGYSMSQQYTLRVQADCDHCDTPSCQASLCPKCGSHLDSNGNCPNEDCICVRCHKPNCNGSCMLCSKCNQYDCNGIESGTGGESIGGNAMLDNPVKVRTTISISARGETTAMGMALGYGDDHALSSVTGTQGSAMGSKFITNLMQASQVRGNTEYPDCGCGEALCYDDGCNSCGCSGESCGCGRLVCTMAGCPEGFCGCGCDCSDSYVNWGYGVTVSPASKGLGEKDELILEGDLELCSGAAVNSFVLELIPGKEYTVKYWYQDVDLDVAAISPSNYRLNTYLHGRYSYMFMLLPCDDGRREASRAGEFGAWANDNHLMSFALGAMPNGTSAGDIVIATDKASVTVDELAFISANDDEVLPLREDGLLRKILAPQVMVDIIPDPESGIDSGNFTMNFYHRQHVQITGSLEGVDTHDNLETTSDPFVSYTFARACNGMTVVTRKEGGRETEMSIAYSGFSNTSRKTMQATHLKNQVSVTRMEMDKTGGKMETKVYDTTGNTPKQVITKIYGDYSYVPDLSGIESLDGKVASTMPRAITYFQSGLDNEAFNKTEYKYESGLMTVSNTDTYKPSQEPWSAWKSRNTRYQFALKKEEDRGGTWKLYDHNKTKRFFGEVWRIQTPYMGQPAKPSTETNKQGQLAEHITDQGRVTEYEWFIAPNNTAADLYSKHIGTKPGVVTTKVNGTPVSLVEHDYAVEYTVISISGSNTHIDEDTLRISHVQTESSGISGAVKNISTFNNYSPRLYENSFLRGQPHSETRPDDTKTSWAYERGNLSMASLPIGAFTTSTTGPASRITTYHGIANTGTTGTPFTKHNAYNMDPIRLVPGKSTRDVTLRDEYANVVCEYTEYYLPGNTWELGEWTRYTYNDHFLVTNITRSNGTQVTDTYNDYLLASQVDETGVLTTYTYDTADRLVSTTVTAASGYAEQSARKTTLTYDAAGRIIKETVSGAGESLTTTYTYDTAGNLLKKVEPGNEITTWSYDPAARKTIRTMPNGQTRIEKLYLDTRVQSIEGTGVVHEHYTYTVNLDGTETTKVYRGPVEEIDFAKPDESTTKDGLGRIVSTNKAMPNNTFYEETFTYNARGLLEKHTRTDLPNLLYEYDEMGNRTVEALDLNSSGSVNLAGDDRVKHEETKVVLEGGILWRETVVKNYITDNSAAFTESRVRVQITGLGTGTPMVTARTKATDVNGNTKTITETLDRAAKLRRITTESSDIALAAQETWHNGLLAARRAPLQGGNGSTGQHDEEKYTYDTLGRLVSVANPRFGTKKTTYWPGTTRVHEEYDTGGAKIAEYTWRTDGLLSSKKSPEGKPTCYDYTPRGELWREWGYNTYPVEFDYDSHGNRMKMKTWRAAPSLGGDWIDPTWPADPGTPDITTWTPHKPSGLTLAKKDATGKTVAYTYTANGQVKTRKWSRTNADNEEITTTYTYTPAGELLKVSYNDGTPGLSYNDRTPELVYAYNRAGKPISIKDATGTRTITYRATDQLPESETLPGYFGTRKMAYTYDTTPGRVGRLTGAGFGNTIDAFAEYSVSYDYSPADGRLSAIRGIGGSATVNYHYEKNSTLVKRTTSTEHEFDTTRTYKPNRPLLSEMRATTARGTATKIGITYETAGAGHPYRKSQVSKTGKVYASYDRSDDPNAYDDDTWEWASAETSALNPSAPAYGIRTDYTYDPESGALASERLHVHSTGAEITGRAWNMTYDKQGNRDQMKRQKEAAGNFETWTYQTDARNSYTQRTVPGVAFAEALWTGTAMTVNGQLAANPAGSYWRKDITVANTTSAVNQQLDYTFHDSGTSNITATDEQLVEKNPEAYTYDNDGNLTGDGLWTYTYDAENRLTAMEMKTNLGTAERQRLTFVYDYLGRRVRKTVEHFDATHSVWILQYQITYLYQGWNIVAEIKNNNVDKRYYWGLDLSGKMSDAGGIGGLLAIKQTTGDTTTHYPLYDDRGNVVALVGDGGNLMALYDYNAFGEQVRRTGESTALNPFGFSTKYTDETGLVWYGMRYYSPSIGRFINRDPIEERGGRNLYAFANNDPANGYDYMGMSEWSILNWFKSFFSGSSSSPSSDTSSASELKTERPRKEAKPIPVSTAANQPRESPVTSTAKGAVVIEKIKAARARAEKNLEKERAGNKGTTKTEAKIARLQKYIDYLNDPNNPEISFGSKAEANVAGYLQMLVYGGYVERDRRQVGGNGTGQTITDLDYEYIWGIVRVGEGQYRSTRVTSSYMTSSVYADDNSEIVAAANNKTLEALGHYHPSRGGPYPERMSPNNSNPNKGGDGKTVARYAKDTNNKEFVMYMSHRHVHRVMDLKGQYGFGEEVKEGISVEETRFLINLFVK